jgi:hypothetical protein
VDREARRSAATDVQGEALGARGARRLSHPIRAGNQLGLGLDAHHPVHRQAAHLVEHVIPRVPVRQWVLSFPMPLRLLFATRPGLLAPVLQIVHRVIATFLIQQAGLQRTEPTPAVLSPF